MQSTKDTFYVALRTALATVNPARTISLMGQVRPAIVVAENEAPSALTAPTPFEQADAAGLGSRTRLLDCFMIHFGAAVEVQHQNGCPTLSPDFGEGWVPLMIMQCVIAYATTGTPNGSGADRGRTLAQLDRELLAITSAQLAPKMDYSQSPAAALDSNIMWSVPQFADPQQVGTELRRIATMSIFFHPEIS